MVLRFRPFSFDGSRSGPEAFELGACNPTEALTMDRHEFRRWVKRGELELYVIAHLIEGHAPVLPLKQGPQLANFRDLKRAVREGRLIAEDGVGDTPNI